MDGGTDKNTTAKARECQFFQWNEGSPSPNLSLTQQDRSHTKEGKRKEGREATGEKQNSIRFAVPKMVSVHNENTLTFSPRESLNILPKDKTPKLCQQRIRFRT